MGSLLFTAAFCASAQFRRRLEEIRLKELRQTGSANEAYHPLILKLKVGEGPARRMPYLQMIREGFKLDEDL